MLEKGNECVIIFVLQENFSAMTRLDQNRAAGQIAEKVNSLFCLKNVSSNLAIDLTLSKAKILVFNRTSLKQGLCFINKIPCAINDKKLKRSKKRDFY